MWEFINELILHKKFEQDAKKEGVSVKLKYAMIM